MRRFLVLLAGGAFLSLTAATEPATPEEAASDAATAAEASAPADPATTDPVAAEAQPLVFTGDEGATNEPASDATTAVAQPVPSTAFSRDLAAAKQQFKQRLAELNAAFLAEKDAARSIALQRQIQQLKLDTEIGYLEIQGRHARAAGNNALADEADTMVRTLRQQLSAQPAAATSQSNDGGDAGTHN